MLLLFVRRVTKRICPFGRLYKSWLHGLVLVFVWQLLEGYTTSFELPFLSQSHKLGVSRALDYKDFVMSWVDFVEDWWYNPEGAFSHLPHWKPSRMTNGRWFCS